MNGRINVSTLVQDNVLRSEHLAVRTNERLATAGPAISCTLHAARGAVRTTQGSALLPFRETTGVHNRRTQRGIGLLRFLRERHFRSPDHRVQPLYSSGEPRGGGRESRDPTLREPRKPPLRGPRRAVAAVFRTRPWPSTRALCIPSCQASCMPASAATRALLRIHCPADPAAVPCVGPCRHGLARAAAKQYSTLVV